MSEALLGLVQTARRAQTGANALDQLWRAGLALGISSCNRKYRVIENIKRAAPAAKTHLKEPYGRIWGDENGASGSSERRIAWDRCGHQRGFEGGGISRRSNLPR